MRDRIDEGLNSIFGTRNNYTAEEIEKAQRRKKKFGGSLMDNLYAVTGRRVAAMRNPEIGGMLEDMGVNINEPGLSNALADFEAELKSETWGRPSSESPFAGLSESKSEVQGDAGSISHGVKAEAPAKTLSAEEALGKFNGVAAIVKENIYGQDDFINKLVVAFKRPFVMPEGDNRARNSIYITGGMSTGRHTSLKSLVKELKARELLSTDDITFMDLAIYPGPSEEKLFLQDLYSALVDEAEVIVFENYENCHSSYLAMLASLVMQGSCRLSNRYILQNGQLVGITNSLASDSVGSLSAKGKYLVFISTNSCTKLADSFGAPFVNALGDVCTAAKLGDDTFEKVSQRKLDKIKEEAPKRLLYNIEVSDDFVTFGASKSEKQRGISGISDFYENVYRALAAARLEKEHPVGCICSLKPDNGTVMAEFKTEPVESLDLFSLLGEAYNGELEEVKKELEEIIGLKEIKEYVLSLEGYYRMQQRRRDEGLKAGEVSKHMIFTGNPGTGKTTIARIISRYLKAIGVLSGGQLVEVSRADLVGRYVGHTAPLVNQVIGSALGGVLFIDEAYSLYRGKDDSFGLEAIDTLVKGIEDNRDDLIVILAGYSKEMQEFLTANSGLKSRFPNIIEFPDYTAEELLGIMKSISKGKGYRIDEKADTALLKYFKKVQSTRAADAGNGRLARNLLEEAILNHSRRLVAEPDADLSLLLEMDFELNEGK